MLGIRVGSRSSVMKTWIRNWVFLRILEICSEVSLMVSLRLVMGVGGMASSPPMAPIMPGGTASMVNDIGCERDESTQAKMSMKTG